MLTKLKEIIKAYTNSKKINLILELYKSQTRYKIVTKEYEGNQYFGLWDDTNPYGRYIVDISESYTKILNSFYVRNRMDLEDQLERDPSGWSDIEV